MQAARTPAAVFNIPVSEQALCSVVDDNKSKSVKLSMRTARLDVTCAAVNIVRYSEVMN